MKRYRLNVSTSLNSKYMRYTYVMLTSLLINQPDADVHIYLLHNDLTDSDQETLSGLVKAYEQEIHFLHVDIQQFPTKLPTTAAWSLETYFRLLLPDILPTDVDRLLYLDVDMIIDKSLRELYLTNFEDNLFCVCKDNGNPTENASEYYSQIFKEQQEQGYIYFNAGMMLWNMEKIRGNYSFDSYMETAAKLNYNLLAPDQDLLNYTHWNQVKFMDEYKYDLFSKVAYNHGVHYDDVKRETCIIHYAGAKPWEGEYVHYDIEQLWWDYAKLTPFYQELMEEFLHSCINNSMIYDTMTSLSEDKRRLTEDLQKSSEICNKLLQILNQ